MAARRQQDYRRPVFDEVLARAHEPRRFIQVLAGPRQVGKTTLARQAMDAIGIPGHFASADAPDPEDIGWLYTQWAIGRQQARMGGRAGGLLVLDEVQKIRDWSDVVKQLWDEDTAAGTPLRVMLLGSLPVLVRQGLSDSLAGRFEVVRVTHWSFAEMRDAFGWDLEAYLFFGGYPGAAPLVKRHERWEEYLLDSIVETNLSRDILMLNRVEKPALLRQLFRLACTYSGQVLSYTKMLGTLTDAGNTVTLAHYLELLGGAARTTLERARADHDFWSRLVRTAVGAHLWAHAGADELTWWREGNDEVDWVVRPGSLLRGSDRPVAIEVRAGHSRGGRGTAAFARAHRGARSLVVGTRGIGLEEFRGAPPRDWRGAG